MGHAKVTVMILDVDLKCCCCYKRVKKVLCQFPQIRDQVFDENKNKVRITVVCCSPEKIRDKLCCKGGKVIQRIEIVEDKVPDSPSGECDKPEVDPPKDDSPKTQGPLPFSACCPECNEGRRGGPCEYGHRLPFPACCQECNEGRRGGPCELGYRRPVSACCEECNEGRRGGPCEYGHGRPVSACCEECEEGRRGGPCEYGHGRPVSACCAECYEGRRGGPCEYGYRRPVPPPPGPCYDVSGNLYVRNRPCYVSRCDYFK